MTRAKFLPWAPKDHQKSIRPNLSRITKTKGKSSSSDCKTVPKDRLKCPDAFRGRQGTLPSPYSFPPDGLIHKAYDTATCLTHCSHQRLSCQRRTAWQDSSYYFRFFAETKIHPDLQSSLAWKTKPRVKSKFFVPSRWNWLNWNFTLLKKCTQKTKGFVGQNFKIRGKKSASYVFSSLGLGCISSV